MSTYFGLCSAFTRKKVDLGAPLFIFCALALTKQDTRNNWYNQKHEATT
jgi:hypothetical protein